MLQQNPTSLATLIQGVRGEAEKSGRFEKFKRMYKNDRVAFAYDCLGAIGKNLAHYQEYIFGLFDDGHNKVAIRAPHGVGKSFMASILVHHAVLTTEVDTKIITTSTAWQQVEHYLWPEIRKIAKYLDWSRIGREPYDTRTEFLTLQIKTKVAGGDVEAFAVVSTEHQRIEGAHARNLLFIYDEAKGIPRETWDAIEGAFSNAEVDLSDKEAEDIETRLAKLNTGDFESINALYREITDRKQNRIIKIGQKIIKPKEQTRSFTKQEEKQIIEGIVKRTLEVKQAAVLDAHEARAFAISTPELPSGQFYDIHTQKPGYEDWLPVHITLEDAVSAGRVTATWAEQKRRQWGASSSLFLNRVLGEFSESAEEGLIPRPWVLDAVARYVRWAAQGKPEQAGTRSIGVDTARGGADKTILAFRAGYTIERMEAYAFTTIPQVAALIHKSVNGHSVHIEMDGGLGAGVYDILRENKVSNLRPITTASSTNWKDKSRELDFYNVRAAMWWNMRELLDPDNSALIMLPPIEELIGDLIAPKWKMQNSKILLEDKEALIKRHGRSPDYGDACCLAFWKPYSGGGIVF